MFLLHLLALLWSLGGIIFTKIITTPGEVILPAGILNSISKLYPPSFFSPVWKDSDGVALVQPTATKSYLTLGAVALYSLRHLFIKYRA